MNKKVAIIIERTNIALGGAERSVFELANALSARGFEADILAAKGQMNARNVHVLCRNQPGKRTCFFLFAKALKKHLSKNHYDIIHSVLPFDFADVYQPRGGSIAESILRNAASYQNKLIESCKKITAFANFRRTMLLHAERRLCDNPSGPVIAALSQYVAQQFKQHYGIGQERTAVIPNGVKINRQIDTVKISRLRTQILTQLDVKETGKAVLFLFAANNFRLKGLGCLIKAMWLAADEHSFRNAYLIVAGSDRIRKYYRLAKKLNVHEKIIFLGHTTHIQNMIAMADAAVLPTFYDPSSRFILEAIAAGKPVITTKFNGATDLFVDNRHGRVIDAPENILQLAKALNYFTDKNNIKKASEAIAADNLQEKISISRVAEQTESLYNQILERRK